MTNVSFLNIYKADNQIYKSKYDLNHFLNDT